MSSATWKQKQAPPKLGRIVTAVILALAVGIAAQFPPAHARFIAEASSHDLTSDSESAASSASTADNVTQFGITWTFSQQMPVGQFANGDWWVVGPVTIASITPDFDGTRNGWEINPDSGDHQGLDDRLEGFEASRVPNLPYEASGGQSIIKAISGSGPCATAASDHSPCLATAAVLTVLDAVPPNNGQESFRPPYFGSDKPMFSTTQLRTELLPSLEPVADALSLESVARRYQRVQVDYSNTWEGRYMHASENYAYQDDPANGEVSEYGPEVATDANEAALRLMLNDPLSSKMPALINYVQAGIDTYGMHNGGVSWESAGGHMLGRKLPAIFAAVLLDDSTMKNEIMNAEYGTYGDDGLTYYTSNPTTIDALAAEGFGPALWGRVCGSGQYEQQQVTDTGPRDCRDPIEMIDGGVAPGDGYQLCCTAQPMKGASLAARLLPEGEAVWNHQPYHDFVDRWVGFGSWASPDEWNADGRKPARDYSNQHGIARDDGHYGSTFVDNMWSAYRDSIE